MRFLNTLKPTSRFLVLAPMFGAAVALLVLAQYPRPATAQIQEFENQYCGELTCKEIATVQDPRVNASNPLENPVGLVRGTSDRGRR